MKDSFLLNISPSHVNTATVELQIEIHMLYLISHKEKSTQAFMVIIHQIQVEE